MLIRPSCSVCTVTRYRHDPSAGYFRILECGLREVHFVIQGGVEVNTQVSITEVSFLLRGDDVALTWFKIACFSMKLS